MLRLHPGLRGIMTIADILELLIQNRDQLATGLAGWTQVGACPDASGGTGMYLSDSRNQSNACQNFVGKPALSWGDAIPPAQRWITRWLANPAPSMTGRLTGTWERIALVPGQPRAPYAPGHPLPNLNPRPNPVPLPETYPWVEPLPQSMPVPFRKLPRVNRTPMRDSGYHPPGTKPQPHPNINPQPRPMPGTVHSPYPFPVGLPMPTGDYVPPVIPDIAIGPINNVRPGQGHAEGRDYEPTIRPGTSHRFQRPPARVKEQKVKMRMPAAVAFALGAVTETDDAVKAIYQALPKKLQTARSPVKRLEVLYKHWEKVDFQKAANNLLTNEVQDRLIGMSSKAYRNRIYQKHGHTDPFGPQTRMGNKHIQRMLDEYTPLLSGL